MSAGSSVFLPARCADTADLPEHDTRRGQPRFQGGNLVHNLGLLDAYAEIAEEVGCTMAQLALAWLLAQGSDIVPIPGTCHRRYAEENARAAEVELDPSVVARLGRLINQHTVAGARYHPLHQAETDTEQFA